MVGESPDALALVKTEVHRGLALQEEWRTLAIGAGVPPWLHPEWITSWWNAYGKGELEVVALREAGSVVALAPLMRYRRRWFSPTNGESPGFGFLASRTLAAKLLAEEIVARADGVVSLAKLDDAGPEVPAIRGAAASVRFRTLQREMQRSPYLEIGSDWDRYEASLSANLRQSLRRKRRSLEREGTVEVEVADGTERLGQLLEEGIAIEGSGWKAKQGTAIASDPRTRRFYTDVARWTSAAGWLRLMFLRLNQRAIAFRFDIECGGVSYHLKGGYDPDYARFSPGNILAHVAVRRAFETGCTRLEFLGAAERHKLEWTDRYRRQVLIMAFPRSAGGVLAWASNAYLRPWAKRAVESVHARQTPQT